ncbi:MAG: hypothetical protein AB1742_03730 [bacterium]
MLKFKIVENFPFPLKKVFEFAASNFEGLEEHIPNVKRIRVLKKEKLDENREKWTVLFHGAGPIPMLARPIVRPYMLRWKEEMIFDFDKLTVEWNVQPFHFREHFQCRGITHCREENNGASRIEVVGSLAITLNRLMGLPDSATTAAAQIIERFIGGLIEPNLRRYYHALREMMNEEQRAPAESAESA